MHPGNAPGRLAAMLDFQRPDHDTGVSIGGLDAIAEGQWTSLLKVLRPLFTPSFLDPVPPPFDVAAPL